MNCDWCAAISERHSRKRERVAAAEELREPTSLDKQPQHHVVTAAQTVAATTAAAVAIIMRRQHAKLFYFL
jgi:hypothetical protein